MRKNIFKFTILATFMGISTTASAHIGTGSAEAGGIIAGFTHPLLGLDHLLAMLAVGLWAGQNRGKILWAAPLSFMAFMAIGGILGIFNFALPITEYAILASLVVFGGMIAFSIKPNVIAAMILIGTFAVFHGHSHGSEMVIATSATQYIIGFVLATGLLHGLGIGIAKCLQLDSKAYLATITGSGIIATGIVLLMA